MHLFANTSGYVLTIYIRCLNLTMIIINIYVNLGRKIKKKEAMGSKSHVSAWR